MRFTSKSKNPNPMISSLYFQLRYLQTLNSISAENNSTIIFPVPIDIISEMIGKVKNIIIITTIFLVLKQKSTPINHFVCTLLQTVNQCCAFSFMFIDFCVLDISSHFCSVEIWYFVSRICIRFLLTLRSSTL